MNFYPFHIGDYISHTSHLSNEEDLAYRRMIDLYYLSEQPFNDRSTIARKIRSSVEVVDTILAEFFELLDDQCWHNKRIDEEIAKYHDRLSQASRAGKASAEKRFNKRSTTVQLTKNHEPRTKNQVVDTPDGVSESVFKDYLEVRKTKKAKWTETALKGLKREAEKANMSLQDAMELCCARGWVGFKADWVKDQKPAQNNDKQWMFSDQGIVAKANELGIHSIGLTYPQLKEKCLLVMAKRAME